MSPEQTQKAKQDLDSYLRKGAWKTQSLNPGQQNAAATPGFSIGIVAIASGATKVADDRFSEPRFKLAVSLVMQPVRGNAGPLDRLPAKIASWASGGIELLVDPAATQTAPPAANLPPLTLQIGDLGGSDDQVEELWQRLMAPEPAPKAGTDWWALLAEEIPEATRTTPRSAEPAIVRVPRSNAGISIALRRAKNIRARTAGILHPEKRAETEVSRSAMLNRGAEHLIIQPSYLVAATTIETRQAVDQKLTPALVAQAALDKSRERTRQSLKDEKKRAIKIAERTREYAQGTASDTDTKKLLQREKSPADQSPGKIREAVEKDDAEFCRVQNADHRALHFAATDHGRNVADAAGNPNQNLGKPSPDSADAREIVRRRLHMLEGLPRLSRLFNLVVDASVEVSLSDLGAAANGSTHAFLSLAAKFAGSNGNVAIPLWTRAKLSWDAAIGPQFWPCTQEEIDAFRIDEDCVETYRTAIPQRAGIVDLGLSDTTEEGWPDPRFDLATVDAVAGIEAESNQELSNEEASRRRSSGASDGPEPDAAFVTLRSAGLALVDRWRQEAAIKIAARATNLRTKALSGQVLDANALQVGWRLDVGVRSGDRTIWRSLCNRMIDLHDPARPFGDAGAPCGSWVEAKLAQREENLPEAERLTRRIRLDGSYIAGPLRRAEHRLDSDSAGETLLHADDLLAQWEGDPLGIECNRQIIFTRPQDDLAIMQVHKPVAGVELRSLLPPPLRFGQKYRFGARVVYRGGVVQPLNQAAELYRKLMDGTAVLPRDTSDMEGRAFLRHERIPPVAVTQTRHRIQTQTTNRYWIPQGLVAVLRQAEVNAGNGKPPVTDADLETESERRILVAPTVGLAFATLHGVFDALPPTDLKKTPDGQTRPRDGLNNVSFSTRPLGGFPVLASDGMIIDDSIGELDPQTGEVKLKKPLRGDAVFQITEKDADSIGRLLPYYPDPAARFMVIRAVRTIRGEAFRGDPALVPLYADGSGFPDAMPVVLDIVKKNPPPDFESSVDRRAQSDIIEFDGEAGSGFLDGSEVFYQSDKWPTGKTGPKVAVRRVWVRLQPGDDIKLEVWCIPDLGRLTSWFDAVESGALLLTAGDADRAKDAAACIRSLAQQTGCRPIEAPLAAGKTVACGAGGMRLPEPAVISEWASQLHKALRQAPIPEIASVQVIQAVYATSRPRAVPRFVQQTFDESRRITYVRRKFNDEEARRKFANDTDKAPLGAWRPNPAKETDGLDNEGATDVMFGGTVQADLGTSDSITLIGKMASPDTDRLDDFRRGFSPEQAERYENEPGDADKKIDLTMDSSLFGFLVGRDGRVTFPERSIPLMQMRDLAPSSARTEPRVLEDLDLVADLKAVPEGQGKPTVWRHSFKDNLARRITLSLQSGGRFGEDFASTTVDRIREAERWRSAQVARAKSPGPVDANTAALRADPWDKPPARLVQTRFSSEQTDPASAAVTLWVDATRRPSRIEPKSLLPAFVWSRTTAGAARRTVVRVRFKRPWFSSGQDERLGVVVWPLDLFSMSPGDASRKYSTSAALSSAGAGGEYITRWGSDPIRTGQRPDGWIVPREVFADYGTDSATFVPEVLMPLPADDLGATAPQKQTVSLTENPSRTMRVSLLTYEPRFDPVQTLWYTDLALDALDLPEPFLRLGLVRYQEHAPENLRVSEPITEWVQLLPKRTVSIAYPEPTDDETGVPIEITVEGPGTLRAAPSKPSDSQALRDRPIMKAQLSARKLIAGELSAEQHIAEATDANARKSSGGLTWTIRLLAPPGSDPRKPPNGTSYHLFVEEVMRMRPGDGTPIEEVMRIRPGGGTPIPRVPDGETGPRFAVSIKL
jgi:hypothetical protein